MGQLDLDSVVLDALSEDYVQQTIDEVSLSMGKKMSLIDLADNYTTGFPSEAQSKSPPKTTYSGEHNWDNIGKALEEGDVDMNNLPAASASSSADHDKAAELTKKAEEHDTKLPPTAEDDSEENWGEWKASNLNNLPKRALEMAEKESSLETMD